MTGGRLQGGWRSGQSGDEPRFGEIHEAYRPRIRRYLARIVGEVEADALTQEVFLRVHRGLKYFRGESRLSTWIYRIATHAALDTLRSPSFRRTGEWGIEPGEGQPDLDDREVGSGEKPSLEQQVVRKEMNLCIQGFVARLPETYREVLVFMNGKV